MAASRYMNIDAVFIIAEKMSALSHGKVSAHLMLD